MPRPKGSKNNKPTGVTNQVIQERDTVENIYPFSDGDKYIILRNYDYTLLMQTVNIFMNINWNCQGGVSVTSYPDGRGGMTFVYCQAMVRKE